MGGSPEAVVYEQAGLGAQHQIEALRDLRARAGAVLAAASVSTAFLGGQALADHSFSFFAWAGVIAYVAVGALNLVVLWPYPWLSALSAEVMLENIESEGWSEADLCRHLAPIIDRNVETNQRILGRLFWVFRASCGALVLTVVSWIALLAAQ